MSKPVHFSDPSVSCTCVYCWLSQFYLAPSPPLDNIRGMVIVWRLRGNIIRTAPCWVVWHDVHSQQHTHVSSSYRSSRLGLSNWDPYAMHRGGCLELYYCNMLEWSWCDSSLIWRPAGFLQCFDTVGLVIWPVKIVPEMTYNVSSGTLSFYTTTTTTQFYLFWPAIISLYQRPRIFFGKGEETVWAHSLNCDKQRNRLVKVQPRVISVYAMVCHDLTSM